MPQYLIAGYLPDDFDMSQMPPDAGEKIHALNREMEAAGVMKFACGLGPARSIRGNAERKFVVTDGPFLEAKEHIGGLLIVECATVEEALEWARKGLGPVGGMEVREIFFAP